MFMNFTSCHEAFRAIWALVLFTVLIKQRVYYDALGINVFFSFFFCIYTLIFVWTTQFWPKDDVVIYISPIWYIHVWGLMFLNFTTCHEFWGFSSNFSSILSLGDVYCFYKTKSVLWFLGITEIQPDQCMSQVGDEVRITFRIQFFWDFEIKKLRYWNPGQTYPSHPKSS